jgi:hypothetical protein
MGIGIELNILWFDNDVIGLRVRASNGRFAGTTDLYVGYDGLKELATAIRDFPKSRIDSREHQLGTFDSQYAGGGVNIYLHCIDSVGHAAMEIRMQTDSRETTGMRGQPESACFALLVKAADINDFVNDIEKISPVIGSRELLVGAAAILRTSEP